MTLAYHRSLCSISVVKVVYTISTWAHHWNFGWFLITHTCLLSTTSLLIWLSLANIFMVLGTCLCVYSRPQFFKLICPKTGIVLFLIALIHMLSLALSFHWLNSRACYFVNSAHTIEHSPSLVSSLVTQ